VLERVGRRKLRRWRKRHQGAPTLGVIDTTGQHALVDYVAGDTVALTIPGWYDAEPVRIAAITLQETETGEYDPILELVSWEPSPDVPERLQRSALRLARDDAERTALEGVLAARSYDDALARIETMVLMSGVELPLPAVRRQISGAIHLILQQSRLLDGSRKITAITEVLDLEDNEVKLQDIFRFDQRGVGADGKVIGEFVAAGYRPRALAKIKAMDIPFDESVLAAP